MFVTFEGIEGSGKSTLAASVARALTAAGREIVVTREPGGTPLGEAVREIFLRPGLAVSPMAEALLINASRAHLVADVVKPALARGQDVLCDRFVDSTLAYQGYGRGLSLDLLRAMCAGATGGLEPDLTLLIDVPYEVSRARLRGRGSRADRVEGEDGAFHEQVREGYLELARADSRIVALDGTLAPDEVFAQAMSALSSRIA
ncbi:MAG TPA: dTMP kinase [Candidatus Baltobacteraceae bacterium]|nr:dTMP kinase [Candidatus Baltobacteraceae bacterium]